MHQSICSTRLHCLKRRWLQCAVLSHTVVALHGFSIAGTEYLTSPKAHRRLLSAFHTHMTAIFLVLSSLSRTAYLHCRPAVATDMVDGNRTPFPMPSLRRPGHCPCNAILTLGTFATGDCMACRRMHVQRIRTSLRIEEKPPPTPTGGSACTCRRASVRLAHATA